MVRSRVPQAGRSVALALLLLGSAMPPGAPAAGAQPGRGALTASFELPEGMPQGFGPEVGAAPRFPDQNTLGWTTLDDDLDVWRKDTDAAPISFELDMGPLANKDQLYDDGGGYWLLLGFQLQGFFVVDNDGKFDPFDGPHDGIGDEPCHQGRFDLFTLSVNGRRVHTARGADERPCDAEGSRVFDIVPMTPGEPANQFRVPVDAVRQGKNTVTIQLHDTGFRHPSADKFNDGWHMFLTAAALELVAPPLFIAHGWNAAKPPGGHEVGIGQWQRDLAQTLYRKSAEHFGQNPWAWAEPGGIWLFGYDGKQDFRVSARQLKGVVWDVGSQVGYCYSCGPMGFWYLGYSMGGLTGRWMVQREGMLPYLGKYVSVGTPHLGSKWADIYTFTVDKLGPPYRDIDGDGLRKWFGWREWWKDSVQARVYQDNDFVWVCWPPCFPHWEGSGALLDHRADFELKRDDNPILAGLNADRGSMASKAFAVAGTGGSGARAVFGLAGVLLLPEGDLIVSVDSAKAGGVFESVECFAVHIEGVPGVPMYMYQDTCVQPVFEFLMGYRGPGRVSGLAAAEEGEEQVPMAEAALREVVLVPDLVTGQASEELDVQVEASPTGFFQALWGDEAPMARLTLVSPSGQEYTPKNASELGASYDARHVHGLSRALYTVPAPEAGSWTLRVEATEDAPAWGFGVVLLAGVESAVALAAEAPARVEPGEAALVTARLTGPAEGVGIEARAVPSNATLALHDDGLDGDAVAGDGVHSALFRDTSEEGEHVLDLTATGTLQGSAFQRTARVALASAPRLDVRVRDLVVAPPQAWWGETVRASAVVENVGKALATGVRAVWSDDADTRRVAPLEFEEELGELAPGASREVQLTWMPSPGLRTLRLEAYADGLEEALDDNRASTTLEVLAAPRTAAILEGQEGEEGWFTGPVTVSLAPWDGTPAPYAATSYRLGGPDWQAYAGPFVVAEEGRSTLEFYSVDVLGNVERVRTAEVAIDRQAPEVGIARPASGSVSALDQSVAAPVGMPVVAGPVDVELLSSDATSGVARLEVRVDGLLVRTFEDPPGQLVWRWDSTTTSTGRHTLSVTARDHAGLHAAAEKVVYVALSRAVQVDNDLKATLQRLAPPVG